MNLPCHRLRDYLLAYTYNGNELPSELIRELQVHLAECDDCRIEVAAWKQLRQRLSAHLHVSVMGVIAPASTWARLQAEMTNS